MSWPRLRCALPPGGYVAAITRGMTMEDELTESERSIMDALENFCDVTREEWEQIDQDSSFAGDIDDVFLPASTAVDKWTRRLG